MLQSPCTPLQVNMRIVINQKFGEQINHPSQGTNTLEILGSPTQGFSIDIKKFRDEFIDVLDMGAKLTNHLSFQGSDYKVTP